MFRLIITTPDGNQIEREVAGTMLIGRASDCQVILPDDAKVSRNHCRIERRGDDFILRDLGSANGTRLNGKKIGQQMFKLSSGDVIGVGGSRIEFRGEGAGGIGGLVDKVTGGITRLLSRDAAGASGAKGAVFGEKTITCSCGTVINTANKPAGQKVGCPRCRKLYVVPGK